MSTALKSKPSGPKAGVLTPRKKIAVKPAIPQEPTATLPDGRVLTVGTIVTVKGTEGKFSFRYARHGGTELTFWGGTPGHEQWRSFTPARIGKVGANVRFETVKASVADVDFAAMTPGQKAAHTKRLKAAAAAMEAAA